MAGKTDFFISVKLIGHLETITGSGLARTQASQVKLWERNKEGLRFCKRWPCSTYI